MSGCIWMFSDRIDDVDLEFAQHDFINYRMEWLEEQLAQLPNVQITESSEFYRNKGTNNYFRKYLEIEKATEVNE